MHTHCIPTLAVSHIDVCTVFLSFAVCLSLALFSLSTVQKDGKCQMRGTEKKLKTCVIVYVSCIVSRQLNLVISCFLFHGCVHSFTVRFIRFKWHIIKYNENTQYTHTHAIASTSSSCSKRIHFHFQTYQQIFSRHWFNTLECCFAKWFWNSMKMSFCCFRKTMVFLSINPVCAGFLHGFYCILVRFNSNLNVPICSVHICSVSLLYWIWLIHSVFSNKHMECVCTIWDSNDSH